MKRQSFARTLLFIFLALVLGVLKGNAAFKNWINTSGGNWFDAANWSPAGVPGGGDAVTITNNGTYSVVVSTGIVSTAVFTIGGGTGKQTLIYGSTTAFTSLPLTNSTVLANGVLMITNRGAVGSLTVKPGGELRFDLGPAMQLYSLAITNQGTLTLAGGSMQVGGTYITNSGLFQIIGDTGLAYGGGPSLLFNSGTIQKTGGTGSTVIGGIDLINLPSGLVDVKAGQLRFVALQTNILGGTFTTTAPGDIWLSGYALEAGATASGTGTFEYKDGSGLAAFYLRSNTIPNLKFQLGDIYILGPNTFQQAGVITNLTLDGARLRGTNRLAGTLTVNSGDLIESLTIQPTGLLTLSSPATMFLSSLNLANQGTVLWTGNGGIALGTASGFSQGSVISNGGTWTVTGDGNISFGGVGSTVFTNAGVFQKTAGGSGVDDRTYFSAGNFFNTPSGIIRATAGALKMYLNYTNIAGEMQLNGGSFGAYSGSLYMTGGKLDGSGTITSAAQFDGGTVQPGGRIQFTSNLALGTNCTLLLDGTGTVPGVTYDQLSVTGAVSISNCTLTVSSLPTVSSGTSFTIITNTTVNNTVGTFKGLPENSALTISGQPFHIHYVGGTGNDVILLKDFTGGPLLSSGGYTNKTYRLLGLGDSVGIHTIQASTNLVQWTNVGFATGDISGNFNFTDTNAANFRNRFYRTTN